METVDLYRIAHLARSVVKEAGDQLNLEWKMAKEATNAEVNDLVAFLKALTGSNIEALVLDAFAAPVGDSQ